MWSIGSSIPIGQDGLRAEGLMSKILLYEGSQFQIG